MINLWVLDCEIEWLFSLYNVSECERKNCEKVFHTIYIFAMTAIVQSDEIAQESKVQQVLFKIMRFHATNH